MLAPVNILCWPSMKEKKHIVTSLCCVKFVLNVSNSFSAYYVTHISRNIRKKKSIVREAGTAGRSKPCARQGHLGTVQAGLSCTFFQQGSKKHSINAGGLYIASLYHKTKQNIC